MKLLVAIIIATLMLTACNTEPPPPEQPPSTQTTTHTCQTLAAEHRQTLLKNHNPRTKITITRTKQISQTNTTLTCLATYKRDDTYIYQYLTHGK